MQIALTELVNSVSQIVPTIEIKVSTADTFVLRQETNDLWILGKYPSCLGTEKGCFG